MATKNIQLYNALNKKSVRTFEKKLQDYKKSFEHKNRLVVERLAERGMSIVQTYNSTGLGVYIAVDKRVDSSDVNGATGYLIEIPTKEIFGEGRNHQQIDVLLMHEYGSGRFAISPGAESEGVVAGRGTFPNQTHAFDPNGWYYITSDGVVRHSSGYYPRAGLQNTLNQLYQEAVNIIREVYNS